MEGLAAPPHLGNLSVVQNKQTPLNCSSNTTSPPPEAQLPVPLLIPSHPHPYLTSRRLAPPSFLSSLEYQTVPAYKERTQKMVSTRPLPLCGSGCSKTAGREEKKREKRKKAKIFNPLMKATTNYKEAFALFDKRGNGRIPLSSLGDLLRACGQNPTNAEVDDLIHNSAPKGDRKYPRPPSKTCS